MKKSHIISGTILLIPILAGSFTVAHAQSLTPAPPRETLKVVDSPLLIAQPLTPEAPPVGATVPPPPEETQQTVETDTTETPASTTGRKPVETQQVYLPEPELPILDIDSSTQETEQSGSLLPVEETTCVDPDSVRETILTPVITNQIKISILVLLTSLLGFIIWLFSNMAINASHGRRADLQISRQERLKFQTVKLAALKNSFNGVSSALRSMTKLNGNKTILDANSLRDFNSAAIDIEIFGSDQTVTALHGFRTMLAQPKLPSSPELSYAAKDLLASLKKDLGNGLAINTPEPPPPAGPAPSP